MDTLYKNLNMKLHTMDRIAVSIGFWKGQGHIPKTTIPPCICTVSGHHKQYAKKAYFLC